MHESDRLWNSGTHTNRTLDISGKCGDEKGRIGKGILQSALDFLQLTTWKRKKKELERELKKECVREGERERESYQLL
jgi:hypothetical protein